MRQTRDCYHVDDDGIRWKARGCWSNPREGNLEPIIYYEIVRDFDFCLPRRPRPRPRTESEPKCWAGLNDGLFSETMDFRDFPSVLSAVRIAQS